MKKRISTRWQGEIKQKLAKSPSLEDFNLTETISFNPAAKWLIWYLTKIEKPFKVINLGAGVKQITTKVSTCPKCHGTGEI